MGTEWRRGKQKKTSTVSLSPSWAEARFTGANGVGLDIRSVSEAVVLPKPWSHSASCGRQSLLRPQTLSVPLVMSDRLW